MTGYGIAWIVFQVSVFALVYTYLGYPLIVYLLSLIRPQPVLAKEIEPEVSVIIAAYNEEKVIRSKIENTLAIDYPKDKLEIIVASDGSTDATDVIAKEFASRGVRLIRTEGRVGKTITQNRAVEESHGEILLFSDATTMYQADVLRKMVPNFGDESVGCVAGKLIYIDRRDTNIGKGARSYWSYETFLKEAESRACSLIGASGCLYAVRRSAYKQMYAEACSDFLICTEIFKQGLRSIYEPDAVCSEETNRHVDREFRMRVRVISQTLNDLWRNRSMMNPFKSGFYAVELFSHKLLRYLVPVFLITMFVSSAFLSHYSASIEIFFLLQVCFYLVAVAQSLFEHNGSRLSVFAMPLYFVLANSASFVGFYKWLSGASLERWEPIRETDEQVGSG
jgi:cellulose synthase/poly-beta-1,6-N-acetylglucosamine synthase-like glycosyltransferase